MNTETINIEVETLININFQDTYDRLVKFASKEFKIQETTELTPQLTRDTVSYQKSMYKLLNKVAYLIPNNYEEEDEENPDFAYDIFLKNR